MKHSLITALALLLTVSMSAQEFSREGMQRARNRQNRMDMTEVYDRMANSLAKDMKLKGDDKEKFTILYKDYQAARYNAMHPNGETNEETEEIDFKNITDEEAAAKIQANFEKQAVDLNQNHERQLKQLEVDKEYYVKFLDMITPAQCARIFLQNTNAASSMRNMNGMGGFGGMGGMGGMRGMGGMGGGF